MLDVNTVIQIHEAYKHANFDISSSGTRHLIKKGVIFM